MVRYKNGQISMKENENYMEIFRIPNPEVKGSEAFKWNDAAIDNVIDGSYFFTKDNVGFICEYDTTLWS